MSRRTVSSYLQLWNIVHGITGIEYGAADDGLWYLGANKDGTVIFYSSPCSRVDSESDAEYRTLLYNLVDRGAG